MVQGAIIDTPHANALVTFEASLDLMNAGLVSRQALMSFNLPFMSLPGDRKRFFLDFDGIVLTAEHEKPQNELALGASLLTRTGRELARVLVADRDKEQIRAVAALLRARGFTTQYHRLLERLGPGEMRISDPLADLP